MLVNFLNVIVRILLRSRFFAALNIVGLSIGIASCIVIYLFVRNELRYDRFHAGGDQIYRVLRESRINGMPYDIGVTSAPFAEALQTDYEGRIQAATRTFAFSSLVRFQEKAFTEERLLLADSNFFEFFSYPLEKGDVSKVLRSGNSIVVSKALAEKYFGDEDPVGKVIRLDESYDLEVSGVLAEVPGNTHLQFDAVGSIGLISGEEWFNGWWNNSFGTYVRVMDPADADYLNADFERFMGKYFGDDFQRIGNKIGLKLEPLTEIYFNNDTRYEGNVVHGDRRYVYVFASVGVLLLFLAAINYINLATAQAARRSKEVGIRKALGSSRISVATQFLCEATLLTLASMVAACILAQLTIPFINSSFGLTVPNLDEDTTVWVFLPALLMSVSVLAGTYPAFLLSNLRPVKVLKGETRGSLQYLFVRKVLVVFQFSMSVFMIIATLFVGRQLRYMHQKDLGFASQHLVIIDLNNDVIRRQRQSFKEALLRSTAVAEVSSTSGHPGGFFDASTVQIQGVDEGIRMRTLWCDNDFASTLGLEMKAGRFFSPTFPSDSVSAVVLNETAARQIGLKPEDAIGRRVMIAQFDSVYKEVVGVVSDYHFASLHNKIEPMIISHHARRGDLLVKFTSNDIPAAIEELNAVWSSYATGYPLEFVFLDELIQRMYVAESRQGMVFRLFSVVSVVIACVGILGLASYIATQRTREIGIRKVLGATSREVSMLLMKDLLGLVAIASALAIPLGYLAIMKWSEAFAYRVPIGISVFAGGVLIVFFLAMLIVGLNASRVAIQNPAKSLRTE